ncbi:putative WD-repeat protein [Operophtera brumata]|uniref:Putative WD-repeat protein n=1 Tax=Operophtera brumata TaxID=104452 RepID=A0A0L7L4K6_OPEBR|nr:putative WD-repeat protein [Operophtera brumata]
MYPISSTKVILVDALGILISRMYPISSTKVILVDALGEVLLDLRGHGGPAYKCRFFPSGQVVISAGADGSCRIWSAENGLNPVTLVGHKMAVTDLKIVEKGRNVVTCRNHLHKDGSAKLWDVGESSVLADVIQERGIINCCTIATTFDQIQVENEREVGTENKLVIIGCESGLVVGAHLAKRQEMFCTQLESPCNACAAIEQSVVQLNFEGTILRQWHESASPVLSLSVLPNQMFILGRQDGACTVISLQEAYSATRVYLTGSDCDGIRDIAFNGKWIFTGCRDTLVRKYDLNQVNVHFK